LETTKTTCKNNIFYYGGHGALRLLRSSRFALTQPDRFATGVFPPADHETGRSCARMAKVVFISCHGCFLFNETYPHSHSRAQRGSLPFTIR